METIVGMWLTKKDPIYGSVSGGLITKMANGVIYYYDQNAFDGFGAEFEAKANDPFISIK